MSFFSDLQVALQNDLAKDVLPVLVADLKDAAANPDQVLNIITGGPRNVKLIADLVVAGQAFGKDAIADLLNLATVYIQKVQIPTATQAKAAQAKAA